MTVEKRKVYLLRATRGVCGLEDKLLLIDKTEFSNEADDAGGATGGYTDRRARGGHGGLPDVRLDDDNPGESKLP